MTCASDIEWWIGWWRWNESLVEWIQRIQSGCCTWQIRQGKGWVTWFLQGFGFPSGTIFVLRMILHVLSSDSFGFINERSLVGFSQQLPLRSKSFGNLWVVHLWIFLSNFPSLEARPNHESVHGSLDVVGIVFLVGGATRMYPSWTHGPHHGVAAIPWGHAWGRHVGVRGWGRDAEGRHAREHGHGWTRHDRHWIRWLKKRSSRRLISLMVKLSHYWSNDKYAGQWLFG